MLRVHTSYFTHVSREQNRSSDSDSDSDSPQSQSSTSSLQLQLQLQLQLLVWVQCTEHTGLLDFCKSTRVRDSRLCSWTPCQVDKLSNCVGDRSPTRDRCSAGYHPRSDHQTATSKSELCESAAQSSALHCRIGQAICLMSSSFSVSMQSPPLLLQHGRDFGRKRCRTA